jgi:hypothetical protein
MSKVNEFWAAAWAAYKRKIVFDYLKKDNEYIYAPQDFTSESLVVVNETEGYYTVHFLGKEYRMSVKLNAQKSFFHKLTKKLRP